jgi:transglutaminase-like putative cysteine protease
MTGFHSSAGGLRHATHKLDRAYKDGGTDSVEVQTHAWLEALLPGTGGRGVKIGHGRTYADVPPIKGVYRGAAGAELEASVRMTRLDPAASARA